MARRIGSVASSPWTCSARGFLAVPQSDLVVAVPVLERGADEAERRFLEALPIARRLAQPGTG